MKNLMYLSLIFVIFSCNYFNDKTEYFEKRFKVINQTPPEKLTLLFLEQCNDKSESNSFKDYTPELINSQINHFYKSAIENNLKLIIDILIYKEILKNKKATIEDLRPIIYKLESDKTDKLNSIVLKSFDYVLTYSDDLIDINNEFYLSE